MSRDFLTAARCMRAVEQEEGMLGYAVVWILASGNLCTPLFIVVRSKPDSHTSIHRVQLFT